MNYKWIKRTKSFISCSYVGPLLGRTCHVHLPSYPPSDAPASFTILNALTSSFYASHSNLREQILPSLQLFPRQFSSNQIDASISYHSNKPRSVHRTNTTTRESTAKMSQEDHRWLLETGKFSDFIIVCQDSKIKAHKLMLCAHSKYFENIMESDEKVP